MMVEVTMPLLTGLRVLGQASHWYERGARKTGESLQFYLSQSLADLQGKP